jgi:hypothetical protein
MTFSCDTCGQTGEPAAFSVEGAELLMTCRACGAVSRHRSGSTPVAASAPHPVPEAELDAPATHCPKCGTQKVSEAGSCPACGLQFALARPQDFHPPEALAAEWAGLAARWAEASQHDALVSRAHRRGELPDLGRLYRLRLARAPGDPMATRGLAAVLRAASLFLPPPTAVSSEPKSRPKYQLVILGCLLVLFAVLLGLLARQLRAYWGAGMPPAAG